MDAVGETSIDQEFASMFLSTTLEEQSKAVEKWLDLDYQHNRYLFLHATRTLSSGFLGTKYHEDKSMFSIPLLFPWSIRFGFLLLPSSERAKLSST
jgi:hypothetical protein